MKASGNRARTVVIGPSWLGDCIMALPAVQRYAKESGAPVAVVAKPAVRALWGMSPSVNEVIPMESGVSGLLSVATAVRHGAYGQAFVLPNSWRTGLVPLLAGVPSRRGTPGHSRGWMLTDHVRDLSGGHQSLEVADLMGVSRTDLPAPRLVPDASVTEGLLERFGLSSEHPLVALVPGAARGPSKRWPLSHFEAVADALIAEADVQIIACGTAAEDELCGSLASREGVTSVAGQTTLAELVGLFACCRTVVCNDSGGMHLAAAAGAPVVAIFGLTDPARTGPLGEGHHLVLAEGVAHDRRIARDTAQARAALESIAPVQVITPALALCAGSRR